MAIKFAVTTSGGYGVLQGVTTSQTAETAEARNADGEVEEIRAYSKADEVKLEGLLQDDDSPAEVGTTITVGSDTYLLTNKEVTESNTEFQKISVTGIKKDSATLTELT